VYCFYIHHMCVLPSYVDGCNHGTSCKKMGTKDYTFSQSCRNRLPPFLTWVTYTIRGTTRKVNIEILNKLEWTGSTDTLLVILNIFTKMFRMNPDIFMSLHDLLVSNYGLKSSRNVSSVESLAMFFMDCWRSSIILSS
jgi:hypothetical protein